MSTLVVIGQKNSSLARSVAQHYDTDIIVFELGQFADEEVFFSLADQYVFASAHILLIYQFCWKNKKQDQCFGTINDQISGLLEVIDCIKSLGAHKVSVVFTYLPYSRQDKSNYLQYKGGVYTLGKCLSAVGVNQVLSCDLHNPAIVKSFPVTLVNISLANFWSKTIQENILSGNDNDFCIATPDLGGADRAQKVADSLGLSLVVINKKRIDIDQACAQSVGGNVSGKHVIIIDDIIDTGRTAASAAQLLMSNGAIKVYGCFSHGIFSLGAQELLKKSGIEKVFITDTLALSENHCNNFCQMFSISQFITQQMGTLLS